MAREYQEAARQRICAFIPINLTCREEENVQRMQSVERVEMVSKGKGKLTDPTILRDMRGRGEIFRFECAEQLELDVSDLQPEEAAKRIAKHVEEVMAQ